MLGWQLVLLKMETEGDISDLVVLPIIVLGVLVPLLFGRLCDDKEVAHTCLVFSDAR